MKIDYHFYKYGFWVRINGVGVSVYYTKYPLFSIRNNLTKHLKIGDIYIVPLEKIK